MNIELIECAGKDTIATLKRLRAEFPATGKYPFVIGDAEELARLREASEFNPQDAAAILTEAAGINVAEWLRTREEELRTDEESDDEADDLADDLTDELEDDDIAEFDFEEEFAFPDGLSPERNGHGRLPDAESPAEFSGEGELISVHRDALTGKFKNKIWTGLAKIEQSWMLPAITKYGGWNDCPAPPIHCAMMRYWQEKYGAEIVAMSGDVIECHVTRPPTTDETAMELAQEQYDYCPDIVDQGTGTMINLAATLMDSDHWYFWWD
jgi:hypothetical protein